MSLDLEQLKSKVDAAIKYTEEYSLQLKTQLPTVLTEKDLSDLTFYNMGYADAMKHVQSCLNGGQEEQSGPGMIFNKEELETETWISVKDTLPPNKQEVMFIATKGDGMSREIMMGHCEGGLWAHCCMFYSTMYLSELVTVTHWMELPGYPETTTKED